MSTIEIKVPDIGDFSDVTIIELLVKPGDTVKVSNRSSPWKATRPAWKSPAATPVWSKT